MANWTDTSWVVILPTKNVDNFLRGFLFETYPSTEEEIAKRFGENDSKDRYVVTFIYLDSLNIEEYKQGLTRLKFCSTCRWSFSSTALRAADCEDGTKQISVDEWCLENDVQLLDVVSDELGMSFRETLFYDKNNDIDFVYDCRDIDYFTCEHCNTYGIWEDYDSVLDPSICPECGRKFEEDDE